LQFDVGASLDVSFLQNLVTKAIRAFSFSSLEKKKRLAQKYYQSAQQNFNKKSL